MSKKHHKGHPPQAVPTPAALEAQARLDLAEGRFRKARDSFKILCKQDREKYLPGLIEANRRLATQLLECGQTAEAEQVLAYLKTIASAETLHGMDLQAALKAADWAKAAALASGVLKAVGVGEEDRSHAADALVLAFPQAAEQAALRLPESLKTELGAILGALRSVSEEQFGHAQDLLRPLPRASIFAGWKILIKGLVAFHTGDAAKAEMLLAQLPENRAPQRAAIGYRLALGVAPPKAQLPAATEAACVLFGAPGIARVFARAHRLWAEGQHVQSYREMRAAPEFPAEEPALPGVLSAFYFKNFHTLKEGALNRYLDAFSSREKTDSWKNPAEARWALRMLAHCALDFGLEENDYDPEALWRKFLKKCPGDEPAYAKLAARVFERLGSHFLEGGEPPPPNGAKVKIYDGDAEDAKPFLEESIRHDATYLPAYQKLLLAHEALHETRESLRLLETMSGQFPTDKAVLRKAGSVLLEQGVFGKGLEYLERARQLDSLDPAVLGDIVRGHTELMEEQYRKKASDKARKTFEKLLEFAEPRSLDLARGKEFLLARRGVLEMLFGEKAAGNRLLATAQETTRSIPALLFFAHLYYRRHAAGSKKTPFWPISQKHRPNTAEERRSVFQVFIAARAFDDAPNLEREEQFVLGCLEPVAGPAFTVEEAAELLHLCTGNRFCAELLTKLARAGLQAAPENLRFQVFGYLTQTHPPTPADLREMQKIRELAVRRGDSATAEIVAEALSQIQERIRLPSMFGEDLCEDFDPIDPLDEDLDPFDFALDQLFPPREIAVIREEVTRMSPSEFAKFCKKISKSMPKPLFDIFLEKITGVKTLPEAELPPFPRSKIERAEPREKKAPPAPERLPAPRSRPAPDSGQLDLF